ncbi:hypothetical protein [Mesorhizobium sp. M0408]|uniref:hypothetical protein n=1 Tax=Mesorhizobium sp. M0408 TaxID=2956942 RepID=UPI003335A977
MITLTENAAAGKTSLSRDCRPDERLSHHGRGCGGFKYQMGSHGNVAGMTVAFVKKLNRPLHLRQPDAEIGGQHRTSHL